jgi:hypothetical protein
MLIYSIISNFEVIIFFRILIEELKLFLISILNGILLIRMMKKLMLEIFDFSCL